VSPQRNDFDPLGADFVEDPHATWARLRESCPVARGARWDFWALTRYDDVVAASSRPSMFTSSLGIVVPRNPVSGRRAPLHYDPPEHARYRRPLNAVLRDERIAAAEPELRALAVELIDAFVAAGGGEFVSAVSSSFAGLVTAHFLNVPRELGERLNAMGEIFERAQAHSNSETAEWLNQLLYTECRRLVEERRLAPVGPEDDLVSALLEVSVDGEPLDKELIAGSVRQLLIAAHVAPTAVIASAVAHLARDPELQQRLRSRPDEILTAVEEFLRYYAPNQGFARTATADVELRGRHIRAGEMVALVLPAANRDPDVFDRPEEFHADRQVNPHLAFGHGPHKCPGATVGRTELRIVVEELLARTASFELTSAPRMLGWPIFGPEQLRLHCVPV
jgi:cytochrome P450